MRKLLAALLLFVALPALPAAVEATVNSAVVSCSFALDGAAPVTITATTVSGVTKCRFPLPTSLAVGPHSVIVTTTSLIWGTSAPTNFAFAKPDLTPTVIELVV